MFFVLSCHFAELQNYGPITQGRLISISSPSLVDRVAVCIAYKGGERGGQDENAIDVVRSVDQFI